MGDFYNGGRHDVTKVGDFYNGGLWGKFLFFVGFNWNFVPGYIKKQRWHTSWKFQFENTSNEKVIAKKPDKFIWNEQKYMSR